MPRTSLSLSSSVKQNMLTPRVVRSLRKRKSGHGSQTSLTTIPAVAAPTARPLVHTLRRRILKRALRTFPRTSRHAAMRPHWRRRSPADAESTPPNRSFECPLRVRPSSCAYDASRLSSASLPPPLPDSAPLPITLPQLNFPLLALFPETDSGYCSDASPSPALTTATAPAVNFNITIAPTSNSDAVYLAPSQRMRTRRYILPERDPPAADSPFDIDTLCVRLSRAVPAWHGHGHGHGHGAAHARAVVVG